MRGSSTIRWIRAATLGLIAISFVVLLGCARPVGSITGKVTYKNKPLKGGFVTFTSTDGQPGKPAEIDEDGTYTIPSITAGNYKVCVDTDFLRPKSVPPGGAGKAVGKVEDPAAKKMEGFARPEGYQGSSPADQAIQTHNTKYAPRFVAIPAHYKSADTTDLTYTVVGGPQTYNIDLK
jgi:hypothetical protein